MKNLILFTVSILTGLSAFGQNLIGYNEKEIKKYMKENLREMSFNNVRNERYKYLKYSDSSNKQTLLFFFNPDSVCHSVRLICDLSVKTDKVKEFNSAYKKSAENRWIDRRDGKDYLIELRDEKWSCVVTIEPNI